MPEKTSLSVLCKARPRMMATTPDVAMSVPTGAFEDVGDDRQHRADIDDADDEILEKPALARLAFEDQKDAHDGRSATRRRWSTR